jgi:hypothetical protein
MERRIQFVSSYLERDGSSTNPGKIVLREDELIELGLPSDYLASGDRVTIRKALVSKFVEAARFALVSSR